MQATHSNTISAVVLPRRAAATLALMMGFAILTALAAQIRIVLPGTPVPITGQTFAVLITGAVLGSWAGAGSQMIYVTLGLVGLPVYAGGNGGFDYATGATLGYLVGFIAAAWVIGRLSERGQDRNVWSAVPAFLTGNAVIYILDVTWLWWSVEAISTMQEAIVAGFAPFVIGDLLKIALAGVLLPLAWRLVRRAH